MTICTYRHLRTPNWQFNKNSVTHGLLMVTPKKCKEFLANLIKTSLYVTLCYLFQDLIKSTKINKNQQLIKMSVNVSLCQLFQDLIKML